MTSEKLRHPKLVDEPVLHEERRLSLSLDAVAKLSIEADRAQGHTVEEVAYLTLGDATVEFIKVLDPTDTRFDPWGIGYRMIALEVDDMDETVEYLKDKGVEITFGPVTLGTGKRAEIAVPNGIPIELRQW
jgi:catechol 2,3-dioxygenase-like lactoylglutathione lyase family enzyme